MPSVFGLAGRIHIIENLGPRDIWSVENSLNCQPNNFESLSLKFVRELPVCQNFQLCGSTWHPKLCQRWPKICLKNFLEDLEMLSLHLWSILKQLFSKVLFLPPYTAAWFEPTSMELLQSGTIDGHSTDWTTAPWLFSNQSNTFLQISYTSG